MLRARLRALQPRLAPAGSQRYRYLRSSWRFLRGGVPWGPPHLSFLLPVDGAASRAIDETIESITDLIGRRWQIVLVGDGAAAIAATHRDPRIVAFTGSGDLAACLSAAAATASGTFVAVVSPGDVVMGNAMRAVVRAAAKIKADVFYGDEIDASKPDWSPELLLAFPYVGRLCAFRRTLVPTLGGWTAETIAADDYRLLLAALRQGVRVSRLGDVIYRRAVPGRTSLVTPDAVEARRTALLEHFAATKEPARVEADEGPSKLKVTWPIDGQPLVSIVIATRDRLSLLRQCIESIERRSTYSHYEIVVADNDSVEPETLEYFAATRHRVVKVPGPFNFSHINNEGARAARGDYVLFLNNDTEVGSPGWIEAMLQYAARPGAGCVGAKLLFANGRVQHAGVVLRDGSAFHVGYDHEITAANWPMVDLVRDVSAVTAACVMLHRQRFLDAGGFDESFPVNYNDVELCVRLLRLGCRHVYTPYATLHHYESSSRPRGVAYKEALHLRDACGAILWNDPFCPRVEVRGTPRWALDSAAGRTVSRGVNAWSRGWQAIGAVAWRPRPLLGLRPLNDDGEEGAIRWIDRVEIQGEVRPALFMHPPSARTYRIAAPRDGRLIAWLALMPDAWGENRGGVAFRVTVARASASPIVREWHIDPGRAKAHRAWVPISVPFRAPAGTMVDVTLSTSLPPGVAPAYAWGIWGQPMIAERRPLGEMAGRQIEIVRSLGWRTAAGRIVRVLRGAPPHPFVMYDAWFREQARLAREGRDVAADLARLSYRPRISVLTPVYNTPPDLLRRMVDSVREQWYPDWQLCLADDASTKPETRAALDAIDGTDPRIHVVRQPQNGGISAATNAALAVADGEFVALLDHDDEITPDALLEVVELLNRHPDADVVYSDEDKLDFDGTHVEPFFKPDWAPEYLNSTMFLGHLVVYRRSLIEEAGRFRSAFDGSQDYDVALRVAERTNRIHHVPRVLYHWRKIQGSAAATTEAKPWGLQAARRALVDHASRLPMRATIEDQPGDGFWRMRFEIVGTPKVSVLVPSDGRVRDMPSGRRDMPLACLRSIVERTEYENYEIVFADNGRISDELARFIANEPHVRRVVYEAKGPFNFAAKLNFIARHATGDHLLLLNDDTEVIAGEWMRAMLEFSQQREIGAVGAKLLFPDGRLQHTGVVVGIGGGACHVLSGAPGDTPGYYGGSWIVRNYSAVTGACCMTRREIFESLGGFDERFATDFNDVDYCLRVREAGYRIVVTPFATLYHFEGATFGSREHVVNPQEVRLMSERWAGVIAHDPYYNPNLTRTALDYSLRL
jgi:GT2 family glycosyltransferase